MNRLHFAGATQRPVVSEMMSGRVKVDGAYFHIRQVVWVIRDAPIPDVDELPLKHHNEPTGDEGIGYISD